MPDFAQQVALFQGAMQRIPWTQSTQIEQRLDDLYPRLNRFFREQTEGGSDATELPNHMQNLLEYLLRHWSTHSPAVKLAVVANLDRLCSDALWPADMLDQYPPLGEAVASWNVQHEALPGAASAVARAMSELDRTVHGESACRVR